MRTVAIERVRGDVFGVPAVTRESKATRPNVLNSIWSVASKAMGIGKVLDQGSRVIELAVLGQFSSIPGGIDSISPIPSRNGGTNRSRK